MGMTGIALWTVGGVVLAVVAYLLVVAAAHRGRCDGRGRVLAAIVGAIVLALAMLNIYHYAVTPRDNDMSAGVSYRSRLPLTQPTTQPFDDEDRPSLTAAERQLVANFSKLFYDTPNTWHHRHWLGVRALQNPNDAWIHQEIIVEQRPDFIIEAGTAAGGSALLWALVLREVNPDGQIITIDIEDLCADARKQPLWAQRIEFKLGSSTDPAIVSAIAERVRGKRVMVILDSDHRKPHVLEELKAYSPMVQVGGYLIVQDTNVNGHPVYPKFGPGPWEAVDEFLAGSDSFVPDRERESMLHTMHPRGYLKRVK